MSANAGVDNPTQELLSPPVSSLPVAHSQPVAALENCLQPPGFVLGASRSSSPSFEEAEKTERMDTISFVRSLPAEQYHRNRRDASLIPRREEALRILQEGSNQAAGTEDETAMTVKKQQQRVTGDASTKQPSQGAHRKQNGKKKQPMELQKQKGNLQGDWSGRKKKKKKSDALRSETIRTVGPVEIQASQPQKSAAWSAENTGHVDSRKHSPRGVKVATEDAPRTKIDKHGGGNRAVKPSTPLGSASSLRWSIRKLFSSPTAEDVDVPVEGFVSMSSP